MPLFSATDICTWFERNSDAKLSPSSGAAIEGLEKTLGHELPPGLALLLEKAGGGIWFYERQGLGPEQIPKLQADSDMAEGCVPFASDVDGNLYVVDTEKKDAVFEWDESGRGVEVGLRCSSEASQVKVRKEERRVRRIAKASSCFLCVGV